MTGQPQPNAPTLQNMAEAVRKAREKSLEHPAYVYTVERYKDADRLGCFIRGPNFKTLPHYTTYAAFQNGKRLEEPNR